MALFARGFANALGEGAKHAVARAATDYEVVCKRALTANIEQHDIFGFLGLQGLDQRT
jgi:hypothetical protein